MADGGWDGGARSLYARFRAGEVSGEEMMTELGPVWRSRPDADPLDSGAAWRAMVDHAGYFTWASGPIGARRARRPRRPQRLFRGATPQRRFGMSWTKDPDIAKWFAAYRQSPGVDDGRVWVGVFEPPADVLRRPQLHLGAGGVDEVLPLVLEVREQPRSGPADSVNADAAEPDAGPRSSPFGVQ